MTFEDLPPVAPNDGLSLGFVLVFIVLCLLFLVGMVLFGIYRHRAEREGIITKYVRQGDIHLVRRRR